jgi:hypothetical protein
MADALGLVHYPNAFRLYQRSETRLARKPT